ncbi:hypothetical protein KEM56_002417 [Ascosphaera pollenicola]|nr:hypothetical protein KEM56_002417 [Ascosphaera pollenicola]
MAVASAPQKILQYVQESRSHEQHRARNAAPIPAEQYEARLDEALNALREQTERQAKELEHLRQTSALHLPRPSLAPEARLAQTRRATAAYRALYEERPSLPPAGSIVPDLLALRETAHSIQGLKHAIELTADDLVAARKRLKREEAALKDARAVNSGLKDRLNTLKRDGENGETDQAQATSEPARRSKQLRTQYRQQALVLEKKTAELRETLDTFIDRTLAAMLAAEELGGPIVGDQVVISDETLVLGYTAQGKERKPKASTNDTRQKKIDAMVNTEGGSSNARVVARDQFKDLLQSLLESASTSSYVTLPGDSVAARFLVKAKIAQFHPRDSTRLRLIDVAKRF